jgi:predicted GTPase
MQLASRALAAGADFRLMGPTSTMLKSTLPVISVCAVRTGCGKSQVARFLARSLVSRGRKPAVIRHPMPYGALADQTVQRFASMADLAAAGCTLEEREEYEPYIEAGGVIFAGVDYSQILERAEAEADLIIWDGGNNDFPFIQPGLSIVVVDALRPDQLDTHHPGTTVLRMADVVIVNKVSAANRSQVNTISAALERLVPGKPVVMAASPVTVDNPEVLRGARVLVVEDGPTITHGGMPHGAGYLAAQQYGALIVDPRASATPEIQAVYTRFPHIGPVLPAMGYSAEQLNALRQTIAGAQVDAVLCGTPIDLARDLALDVPVVRAHYSYQDMGWPSLLSFVDAWLAR